jgi:hypothetical protein
MKDIIITKHAYKRAKERMGVNKNALNRIAKRAFEKGLKQSDVNGKIKEVFEILYNTEKTANNIRIYGEFIYIFADNRLLTVIQVNNEYKNYIKNHKKLGE